MTCPPPVHPRPIPGVCVLHPDPPCGLPTRPYLTGWQCEPPDNRRNHPLAPKPEESTNA